MRGVASSLDDSALRTLLQVLGREARDWRFGVAPNPNVGAAVLAGSRVVARGFHRIWGEAHAEVNALERAAASDVPKEDWDTMVVTLEPCSSVGKTGSCAQRILDAGIKRVIVGALDPDARSRGAGLKFLEEAGVEVLLVPAATPLEDVAPHFLRWTSLERLRRPRPWTIAKWAQTLSGQLSPPEDVGAGRWISGPESLAEVQLLRSRVDAIITGSGTVQSDDPRLTVRPPASTMSPPIRVVLDSYLRTHPDSRLFQEPGPDEQAGCVHILCLVGANSARARDLEEAGARVHGLRGLDRKHLDLREVQSWLWEQGVRRSLLEAGPTLVKSFLEPGEYERKLTSEHLVRDYRRALGT